MFLMRISKIVKYQPNHDRFTSGLDLYRQTGMEPNFSSPLKSDFFITPTDEKQRKWTNKVSLSAPRHRPRGDG